MNKILLVTFVLLSALLSWGQNIVNIDNILYTINDGEAQVARQDRELSGSIVIPKNIPYGEDSVPVTSIVTPTNTTFWSNNTVTCEGGAFQGCANITDVTIHAEIKDIPFGAFYDCQSLEQIYLPNSVKTMGPGAFANCFKLQEFEIPDSVSNILTYTFGQCKLLKNINLTSQIRSISNGAFKDSGLDSISIPIYVNSIGEHAFSTSTLNKVRVEYRNLDNLDCSLIAFEGVKNATLYIPQGTHALYANREPWSEFKQYVEFEDNGGDISDYNEEIVNIGGIRYIIHYDGKYAVVGKQSAELVGDIVIPDTIEFKNFKYPVTAITAPTDMTSYSDGSARAKGGAFQNTKITSITLPASITLIPVGAFQDCRQLTEINLPDSVKIIECAAFAGCTSLKGIELPDHLQELGSASFGYAYKSFVFGECDSLETVIIPERIIRLGEGAFLYSGIKQLELSKNITEIEEHALRGTSLEQLTLHCQDARNLKYTDSSLGDLTSCTLYVPLGAKYLYQEFYPWNTCSEIIEINDGQEQFIPDIIVTHIDNVRYFLNEDSTATVQRQDFDLSGDIVVPETITLEDNSYTVTDIVEPTGITAWSNNTVSTEGGAFQNCKIRSISLPSTITTIPAGTFYGCDSLQNVELPENLTSIGAAAFAHCSAIEEIFIPETVTDFGCNTAYGYKSYVFGECKSLQKINIPANFTTIPEACFKNSGLTTMLIPETMTSLQTGCFELPNLMFVKIRHADLTNLTYTESIFPDDLSDMVLLVPKGSKDLYSNFYPWRKFGEIEEYEDTDDEYNFTSYAFNQDIAVETDEDNQPEISRSSASDVSSLKTHKKYLPSGKLLNNLIPEKIDGYIFVRWENIPSFMPGQDTNVRAVYKADPASIDNIKPDTKANILQIYSTNGVGMGNSFEALPRGIYIIKYEDGTIKKLLKQ